MTRGCPFGTVGNGVTDKDELIRQDLSHLFEIVKNKLRAFFIREKAQGRLAADADEDRLADFCIATIQGAMLMDKVKRSPQPVEAVVREALSHLRRDVVRSAADQRRARTEGRNRASDELPITSLSVPDDIVPLP
jgi:hypothetical protein